MVRLQEASIITTVNVWDVGAGVQVSSSHELNCPKSRQNMREGGGDYSEQSLTTRLFRIW